MSMHPARKGFTLVELLVVISIIALLASLLMPALSEARGQAMVATCSNNLHTDGVAVLEYSAAYGLDRPFLFHDGTGQGCEEDEYSATNFGVPPAVEPANPALALCHPYGDQAFEWFLDDPRCLWCFANPYKYEINYVYHPKLLQDDPMPRCTRGVRYIPESGRVWGTYRYAYKQVPFDQDPFHMILHKNTITTDTPKRARNVVMHDWHTDDSQFSHYNMLQVDASVIYAGGVWEDMTYYLYGEDRGPYGD